MVFLSGALIAVLMLYGSREFLIYAICIALLAELLNVTIMNRLVKSKENSLQSRHAQSSDKLKRMLYKSQEREEELQKTDIRQREEISVLRRSLDEQAKRLEDSLKSVSELKEQLRQQQEAAARSESSPLPKTKKKDPISLF